MWLLGQRPQRVQSIRVGAAPSAPGGGSRSVLLIPQVLARSWLVGCSVLKEGGLPISSLFWKTISLKAVWAGKLLGGFCSPTFLFPALPPAPCPHARAHNYNTHTHARTHLVGRALSAEKECPC